MAWPAAVTGASLCGWLGTKVAQYRSNGGDMSRRRVSAGGAMPRFFFHFRKGRRSLMDRDGETLQDDAGARAMALSIGRDFVDRALGRIAGRWAGWSIDVRDQHGRRILLMPLEQMLRVQPGEALDQDGKPSPRVVHLDMWRSGRVLSALINQTRRLGRQASMVSDRQRYVVSRLGHEI